MVIINLIRWHRRDAVVSVITNWLSSLECKWHFFHLQNGYSIMPSNFEGKSWYISTNDSPVISRAFWDAFLQITPRWLGYSAIYPAGASSLVEQTTSCWLKRKMCANNNRLPSIVADERLNFFATDPVFATTQNGPDWRFESDSRLGWNDDFYTNS